MAGQMRLAYERIGAVLGQVGLSINDVVDETIYTHRPAGDGDGAGAPRGVR